MNYFENKSQSLYFKVWEIAALPNSFYKNYSVHNKNDYYVKESWIEIFKENVFFLQIIMNWDTNFDLLKFSKYF